MFRACSVQHGRQHMLISENDVGVKQCVSIKADVKQYMSMRTHVNMCPAELRHTTCVYWDRGSKYALTQIKENMLMRNCAQSTWHYNQRKRKSRGLQTMDDASGEHATLRRPACSAWASDPLTLPCKMLTTLCCLPGLDLIWTLGPWVCYPPVLLCDVLTDYFWVVIIVTRWVWIWTEFVWMKPELIA